MGTFPWTATDILTPVTPEFLVLKVSKSPRDPDVLRNNSQNETDAGQAFPFVSAERELEALRASTLAHF